MAVKNSQRFAEIERLMGDYFGCHLAPVMGTGCNGTCPTDRQTRCEPTPTVRLASYAHWPLPICLVMTHTPR